MKYFEFADKYFEKNIDKYDAIKIFEDKRELKLFDKLLYDQNEINFLSWLSEMKFGLKLENFFTAICYDKIINNQTPDWIVSANGQTIIFEVLRINLDEKVIINKIEEFKNPPPKDSTIIANVTHSKVLDGKYFYGAIDKIAKKEISYRQLIESNNFPFVVCVDCFEIELFTFYNDFTDFFIGGGKNGYFQKNIKFGENVSGLFVLVPFEGYKFLNNPNATNKLFPDNQEGLLKLCD